MIAANAHSTRRAIAMLVAAALVSACDAPLVVTPTRAPSAGLTVCWRDVDDSDLGLERPVRVAMGRRLEAAGYELVRNGCDLAVGWSFTTRGRGSDEVFRSARMTVRRGDGTLVDHGAREFGPSDMPTDDPDRLATLLVNALNGSPKVTAVHHTARHAPFGRLAPAVIQGIVRAHFGAMKHCYETGLAQDPTMGGRTATRFVIDRAGHVSSADDVSANSKLPADMRECVTKQFAQLEFPPPDGGIVTVVYPLIFAPTNDAGASDAAVTPPSAGGAFDRDAAAAALDAAARDLDACASLGVHGEGHVQVTFDPSGEVTAVALDGDGFPHTPAGACVTSRFSKVHTPAFSDRAVSVGKSFHVN